MLNKLGSKHVLVVHAEDGMDEISIGAPTHVAELKDGRINSYTITPEQFDLARGDIASLAVDSAEASLAVVRAVLQNQPGPARDIVLLNAGAAIYAADLVPDLEAGIKKAADVIADGSALAKLDALVKLSRSFEND